VEDRDFGPVDPTLSVLRVETVAGAPLGHVVHFSGHPTTAMGVDELLSADYPGVLLAETEATVGGVGLFVQGTCGNINLEIGERKFEHAERHGRAMGRLAAQALASADVQTDPALSIAETTLEANVRQDFKTPEDVQSMIDEVLAQWRQFETEHPGERIPSRLWNPLRKYRLEADSAEFFGPDFTVPVIAQHVRLASRNLLITPGEWFVDYALRLKAEHADARPIWIGYGNGHIGYVPTFEGWADPGYMDNPSRLINFLARGEGDRLYGLMSEWMTRQA
jgi:hypothetical protein